MGPLCVGCRLPVIAPGYCDDCRISQIAREHRTALARAVAKVRHGEVLEAEREEMRGRSLASARKEGGNV